MKQAAAEFSELDGTGLRVALVTARFNRDITQRLADGAHDALVAHGVATEQIDTLWVPGAFEIPVVLERLAQSGRYDALVALACVVRGETPHFDVVVDTCGQGCANVARTHGIAVGFGVLTTDDWDQAEQRVGGRHGHKGQEAALAALETALVLRSL